MELVDKHEGRLTPEVFKGYCKMAQRMNMERIAHEKEVKDPRQSRGLEDWSRSKRLVLVR